MLVFKKLNWKNHNPIVVLNAPPSFDELLLEFGSVTVEREAGAPGTCTFGIAFATTQRGLDEVSTALTRAAAGDAVLWIAYPKKSSPNFRCEFDRDNGWYVLGTAGYEPVRQIAIDEDWSAIRFRRVELISTLTRSESMAISSEGKRRTAR
jgi:hypothetical protein